MSIRIALAGNPNSGKTTLFNALTGSNQYVGNWPGVTVEKKEGKYKGNKEITITDLPGIYSLSPYTLEEVVARNYLLQERPDAILNIVDGTNLERNLYLTTQLLELGIPVVVAVNMMDIIQKNGDQIYLRQLSEKLGCQVVAISALKGTGIQEAVQKAAEAAARQMEGRRSHRFSAQTEGILASIESRLQGIPESQKRFYAIKLFERDDKIRESGKDLPDVEQTIRMAEEAADDDSESIITDERYSYISSIIKDCYTRKDHSGLTVSDRIDRVVTNRFLALPIFAAVMILVYYISISTIGGLATDWVNDGIFGDGWHLLGIGSADYEEQAEAYEMAAAQTDAYIEAAEAAGIHTAALQEMREAGEISPEVLGAFTEAARALQLTAAAQLTDEDGEVTETIPVSLEEFEAAVWQEEPDPAEFGVWVPGLPGVVEDGLTAINCADWLKSLLVDGMIAGVGAVLGFVPQMLILFLFLAFLEGCGYMARIAFIMDRIFRKFGLSGKSFIPMLIGTGCGVPAIMASRTIENDRDRKMTIMTTTFIPCSAKLPIIALIAGALFGRAWWVAPSAYFVGVAAIIVSGIILKKTKMFSGDPAPFVMELPAYHWPTAVNILRSMWERGWSFIKKAGTVILLSTIFIWFTSSFGFVDGSFGMVGEDMNRSLLAVIGSGLAWLFAPLGWGNWQSAVAAITGLVAKENVVGTFGILYGFAEVSEHGVEIWGTLAAQFTPVAAYSFLVFNLLCAPCFAAMGAMKREMNNARWFWYAVGYQTIFAYAVSLCIYQVGNLLTGGGFGVFTIIAFVLIALFIYLLVRPGQERLRMNRKVKIRA